MKSYKLKFEVKVYEAGSDYSPVTPLEFTITEKLPANVDPQTYIRRRLAEELKRNFDALPSPIDNKTEDAAASDDPLTPF
jgi:hypothetical protein